MRARAPRTLRLPLSGPDRRTAHGQSGLAAVLPLGTVVTVPFDSRFDRAEAFVTRNWLEERTSLGTKRDYALPGQDAAGRPGSGALPAADVVPAVGGAAAAQEGIHP